jgi:hypothetical protein
MSETDDAVRAGLTETAEAWLTTRQPVDPAPIARGGVRGDQHPRRRVLVAAVAAVVASAAGALVLGGDEDEPDGASLAAVAPDEVDDAEDQLPGFGGPSEAWGSPRAIVPLDGQLYVLSAPPWDGTPVPDGPGGISRVDPDRGEAEVLAELEGAAALTTSGGELWAAAGNPTRVVRLDPATGEELERWELPSAPEPSPSNPFTNQPDEPAPLLLEPAPDGVWFVRSHGFVSEVFRVRSGGAAPELVSTIGGAAHAAARLADGTLWLGLDEAGVLRVPADAAPGADLGPARSLLGLAVRDLEVAGGRLWVFGNPGGAAGGSNTWAAVELDPSTGAPLAGSIRVGVPSTLVASGDQMLVRTPTELRSLPDLAVLAAVRPGTRAAVVIDGEHWVAGAWWVARLEGDAVPLPGGTLAAPATWDLDPPPRVFNPPEVPMRRRDGRLLIEVVEPSGARFRIDLPDTVPFQGTIGVTAQGATREEGVVELDVQRTAREPEHDPCRGDECPEGFEAMVDVAGGRLEVYRIENSEPGRPVEVFRWARLHVDGWEVRIDAEDRNVDELVEIASGISVEETPDGYPVLRSTHPDAPVRPAVAVVELWAVGQDAGLRLSATLGCADAPDPRGTPSRVTCQDGVEVAVEGAPGLVDDVLATVRVTLVG